METNPEIVGIESPELDYSKNWVEVKPEDILLEGGVTLKEVGIPEDIPTSTNPDVAYYARLLKIFKDNLTIANLKPEYWQESSVLLKKVILDKIYGYLQEYEKKEDGGDLDPKYLEMARLVENKETDNWQVIIENKRIEVLRGRFSDISDENQSDEDFLFKVADNLCNPLGEHYEYFLINPTTDMVNLTPRPFVLHDKWRSKFFGDAIGASYYDSDLVDPSAFGMDRHKGAFQKIANRARGLVMRHANLTETSNLPFESGLEKTVVGEIPNGEIQPPPNLTSGYAFDLPYLASDGSPKELTLRVVPDIDRVNPSIFLNSNSDFNGTTNEIVATVDREKGKIKILKSVNLPPTERQQIFKRQSFPVEKLVKTPLKVFSYQ